MGVGVGVAVINYPNDLDYHQDSGNSLEVVENLTRDLQRILT